MTFKNGNGSNKYPSSLLDSFLHDTMQLESIALNSETTSICRESKIVPKVIERGRLEMNTTPLSNDELFLMIDDGTGINNDDNDSNVHVEYRQYYLNKKIDLAVAAAKVSVSSSNSMPEKRKSISRKLEFDALRQNCHNKRLIKHLCENINQRKIRQRRMNAHGNNENDIHNKIDKLMLELHDLTTHEEKLMETLKIKCERYHNQNNKYKTNLRLQLCIDEVQHNLDVYAKEIVNNELELHEIQTKIQQKYEILFNLIKKSELFNSSMVANHESDDNKTFNTSLSNDKSLII